MTRRRFVHRDDASKALEIFLEDTSVAVLTIRGNFRQKAVALGGIERQAQLARERGYVEVDEHGAPLEPVVAPLDVSKLENAVSSRPYETFAEAQRLLVDHPRAEVLSLLLRALEAIEADVDEHDGANYNAWFPPTDEDEPTYDALHDYRAHYTKLTKSLERGKKLSAASLKFRV